MDPQQTSHSLPYVFFYVILFCLIILSESILYVTS